MVYVGSIWQILEFKYLRKILAVCIGGDFWSVIFSPSYTLKSSSKIFFKKYSCLGPTLDSRAYGQGCGLGAWSGVWPRPRRWHAEDKISLTSPGFINGVDKLWCCSEGEWSMIGREPAASWRSRKPNQMKDREVLDKQRRASRVCQGREWFVTESLQKKSSSQVQRTEQSDKNGTYD